MISCAMNAGVVMRRSIHETVRKANALPWGPSASPLRTQSP